MLSIAKDMVTFKKIIQQLRPIAGFGDLAEAPGRA